MTTETLDKQKEMETSVNALVTETQEFKVEDDEDLQRADLTLLAIQDRLNKVGELMDPICEAAHETHKKATTARAKLKTPLEAAKLLVTKIRGAYLLKVETKRKADEAEAKRLADEAQAAATKKWNEEQAALAKQQEDARLETAVKLEAEGKTELAEHVMDLPPAPLPLAPPPQPVSYPSYFGGGGGGGYSSPTKTSGVKSTETYKAVYELEPVKARAQLLAMVKAAADKPDQFLDFLELNTSAINAYVKRTKGAVPVPGVEIIKEIGTSVSAGRK